MITMPLIDWKPTAAMPEDRKDGRDMLVWNGQADVAVWAQERWRDEGPGWNDTGEGMPINEVTFWADINPPE